MKKLSKKTLTVIGGALVIGLVAYAALSGQMTGSLSQGSLTTAVSSDTNTTLIKLSGLETYAKKASQSIGAISYALCGNSTTCKAKLNVDVDPYMSFTSASTIDGRLAFLESFRAGATATFFRQYSFFTHYLRSVLGTWDNTAYYNGLGNDSFGLDKYLTFPLVAASDTSGRLNALSTFKTDSLNTIKIVSEGACMAKYGLGTALTADCIDDILYYVQDYL